MPVLASRLIIDTAVGGKLALGLSIEGKGWVDEAIPRLAKHALA